MTPFQTQRASPNYASISRLPDWAFSSKKNTAPWGLLHPRGPHTTTTQPSAGLRSIFTLVPGLPNPIASPKRYGVSPKRPHTTRKAGGVSREREALYGWPDLFDCSGRIG